MTAKILVLDSFRTTRSRLSALPERLPLALSAHPDAVCMIVGDRECWLSPAQSRELASDLNRLSDEAERLNHV